MAAVEVKLEGVELGMEGAVVSAAPAAAVAAAATAPAGRGAAAERQLRSGDSLTIDTGKDSTTFSLGLRWDEVKDRNPVDLDAACIALDSAGNYLTTCYFGELKCFSGALVHSGDSRDGKSEGDDEVITINLVDLPPNVAVFYFVINSYHGDTFMEVETAEASLTCLESKRTLLYFNLTCQNAEATALLFARLFRDPSNPSRWTFTAVGSGVRAPSFSALIPQVQERCRDIIPGIVPAKVGDVVFLVKGESVSLGSISSAVTLGLGWDFFGESIDLDASLVCYGSSMEELARVSFSNKVAFDGLIKHSGDNVTGQGDGDDEQIVVRLSELPPSVLAIAICVTSFRGHTFAKIKGAYCRIFDSSREMCRYSLSNCSPSTAYVMATLSRRPGAGVSEWSLKAHGVAGKGQTVADCVDPMRALIKQDFGMPLDPKDHSDLAAFRAGVPAAAPVAAMSTSSASAPPAASGGCCTIL